MLSDGLPEFMKEFVVMQIEAEDEEQGVGVDEVCPRCGKPHQAGQECITYNK